MTEPTSTVTTDSADSVDEMGGGAAAPLSLRERVERLGKPPASWFKGNVCLLSRGDARKLYGKKVPRKTMRQNLPIQGATAFLGPPGSGKTMFLTQAAANLSAAGCQVFSNSMELAFEDGHFRNFDELTDMVLKVAEMPWEERPFHRSKLPPAQRAHKAPHRPQSEPQEQQATDEDDDVPSVEAELRALRKRFEFEHYGR